MEHVELTAAEATVLEVLREQFGDAITGHSKFADQVSVFVRPDIIFELAQVMKDDKRIGCELLSDICGVDWILCPEMRFELVYNFYKLSNDLRILVRTTLPDSETPVIQSIQPVYSGADWLEREVYDMLGISFEGHPDLRRIITPDGLEGWPHRKDFPLMYEEPQFSYNKNRPPEITK